MEERTKDKNQYQVGETVILLEKGRYMTRGRKDLFQNMVQDIEEHFKQTIYAVFVNTDNQDTDRLYSITFKFSKNKKKFKIMEEMNTERDAS